MGNKIEHFVARVPHLFPNQCDLHRFGIISLGGPPLGSQIQDDLVHGKGSLRRRPNKVNSIDRGPVKNLLQGPSSVSNQRFVLPHPVQWCGDRLSHFAGQGLVSSSVGEALSREAMDEAALFSFNPPHVIQVAIKMQISPEINMEEQPACFGRLELSISLPSTYKPKRNGRKKREISGERTWWSWAQGRSSRGQR